MSAAPRRTGSALLGILGIAVVAGLMLTVGVMPAVALTGMGAKGGIGLFAALPDDLKIAKLQQKTQIYANDGKKEVLLASFYNQNREVITWHDVPATVKNATLAAEDVRFYQHGGVDPMGILSALAGNVLHSSNRGASTISQQYVKNVCIQEAELLPTQAKVDAAYDECTGGVQRKLREARLAIGLEKAYPKNTILLGYLNIAGFGGRIYGIESAAQYYFDTHAKDLTVAQAASLMAIVNNPDYLRIDSKANIPANKVRRDYILDTELKHKMITQAQYDQAVATPITPKITPTTTGCAQAGSAAYFCDYVVNVIKNDTAFGRTADDRYNKLQSAGWKIYTTLDMGLQKQAKTAMSDYVPTKSPSGTDMGGAAVTVQPGTGHILSMVQSKRYDDTGGKGTSGAGYTATSVNWNTDQAYGGSGGFQPGSSYKTFTLIDWLEHGHGLNEIVDGNGRSLPAGALTACGKPAAAYPGLKNDEANEGGYQTVMQATARSVNGAYGSMAEKLDLCDIRDRAQDLLVHRADQAPLEDNPSSILGTNTIAPLTMATAYAGIADQGKVCSAVAIDKIVASDGTSVAVPTPDCHQGIPQSIAVATGYALHGVLQGDGTAAADAGASGSAWSFAKTGTTNDALDTWVVGGTTKAVTAVWVGNVGNVTSIPRQSLRLQYSFPGCDGTTQAAQARHCLWSAITRADQAQYPGATSWPQPDPQYLYGQKIAVPDVTGKSVKDAKAALLAAGFQAKVGGSTASDTIPAGSVASTDPAAGSEVSGGSLITIVKSSGAQPTPQPTATPPATGTVPTVLGVTIAQATAALAAAGYTNLNVQYFPANGQLCRVLQQTPTGGAAADPTSTQIMLNVAGTQALCQP